MWITVSCTMLLEEFGNDRGELLLEGVRVQGFVNGSPRVENEVRPNKDGRTAPRKE